MMNLLRPRGIRATSSFRVAARLATVAEMLSISGSAALERPGP